MTVGASFTVTFKDGTVQQWKLLELSDLEHFLTYDLIESEPAVGVLSAIHTIRLRRVSAVCFFPTALQTFVLLFPEPSL